MFMRRNLHIIVILFLFLGANWVLINLLPRELMHAHTTPTASAAGHYQTQAAAPQAELTLDGAAGFYQ